MSVRELIEQLIPALGREADHHDSIRTSMVAMRGAFTSVRPDEVERGMPALTSIGQKAVDATEHREEICARLAEALGIRGELTMTKLLPHVPRDLVGKLTGAAVKARDASRKTRIESRVGERLLELSGRLLRQLVTPGVEESSGATIYDKKAQLRQAAARRGTVVEGML